MAEEVTAVVDFSIRFATAFAEEECGRVVALCVPLDVMSQGATEQEARKNLTEAVQLFIESCFERGTLEQVLKECGGKIEHQGPDRPDWLEVKVPLSLVAQQHAETRAD